jgi:hypothetical protein
LGILAYIAPSLKPALREDKNSAKPPSKAGKNYDTRTTLAGDTKIPPMGNTKNTPVGHTKFIHT